MKQGICLTTTDRDISVLKIDHYNPFVVQTGTLYGYVIFSQVPIFRGFG